MVQVAIAEWMNSASARSVLCWAFRRSSVRKTRTFLFVFARVTLWRRVNSTDTHLFVSVDHLYIMRSTPKSRPCTVASQQKLYMGAHVSSRERRPKINLCNPDPDVANKHNSCPTSVISSDVTWSSNFTSKGEARMSTGCS